MYKHYIYRTKGAGWHITENQHTMHEMSCSHGGANSDFCSVFWARLPPPRKHNQTYKIHFNNNSCIFTEIMYQPKLGYACQFLHCYCMMCVYWVC